VIDAIVGWFFKSLPTCLSESGLHKAIGYMVHIWPGLLLFLDTPPATPSRTMGPRRAVVGASARVAHTAEGLRDAHTRARS
jgi:hypothetical protein